MNLNLNLPPPCPHTAGVSPSILLPYLCHLLAPILCYTSDEAWECAGNEVGSIHLATFPAPDPAFGTGEASATVETLLGYRNVIQQSIEPLRQDKVIRANAEAEVTLTLPDGAAAPAELLGDEEAVCEFFILSSLEIERGGDAPTATASKSGREKCPRCWRLTDDVGKSEAHPELCHRCSDALSATS